jgi:thioredoxin 1
MDESLNTQTEKPMHKLFRNLFLLALFISGSAFASGQPFKQADFDALQKAGKPIVVMIHANWCPTCKAQEPILDALLKEPRFQKIAGLRVDFDDQKKIVREFHATYQSTLIVFKAGKEVGRSTGDTTKEGIAALLAKAL